MVSLTHHCRGPPSPKTGEGESFQSNMNFSFFIREKVAVRPDEGLVGELGVWLTDWPDDAQHIDPAVDESSFGRECGVS